MSWKKDSCSDQWLRAKCWLREKCFVNCWKKMVTRLTTASFDQTAADSMCWNCSMSCSARHWTGCCSARCSTDCCYCCSATYLTDRCCCWSSVQPTWKTKRTESDPNSAAVPTLESATCSGQQMEIAVGLGRSSESLSGTRCLAPKPSPRSTRVPFRADRDSSSLIPPADVIVDECLLQTKCAIRRPTDKDLVQQAPYGSQSVRWLSGTRG